MNSDRINPKPFLEKLKGENILVRLKWGQEYKGILLNYDDYFNLQVKPETQTARTGI